MDLFLYFGAKFFGMSGFATMTVIFMIIEILVNVVVGFIGAWSNFIWAVVKVIALIVFVNAGFPPMSILVFFIVLYAIASVFVFVDPIGGGINIVVEILNVIGFFLFKSSFL